MVYLLMDPVPFGLDPKQHPHVRAAYTSLEDAQGQAEHNLEREIQRPLRIVDETDGVLVNYEDPGTLAEVNARIEAKKKQK